MIAREVEGSPNAPRWNVVHWMFLLLLAFLALMTGRAHAAVGDDAGTGTLYFSYGDGAPVKAPALNTDVRMEITGIVARVEVKQQFRNDDDRWVEGLYAFPLPENSAVDRMHMRIGERIIEGEIKEKVEAQKLYEAARDNGQHASLVQQHRPNLFRTSVANIAPHETVEITIGYLQVVSQQAGRYSIRFPLTITPRYLPGGNDDIVKLTSESRVAVVSAASSGPYDATTLGDAQPTLAPADTRYNSVNFEITVQAGVPLQEIASTYHRVRFQQRDTSYRVELADRNIAPDHDFELAWTPVVHGEPAVTLFREKSDLGEHVLIMFMPPHERIKLATPREVIFIVDTSGSMEGESIAQARAALLKALSTLSSSDKFNVIQFNSVYNSVFPTTVLATEDNLRKARTYVGRLYATGGTEMLPALQFAMSTPTSGEYLRQILFMTDGAVGNEDQLTREIHEHLGNARLFTVGIGSAPNGFFMRKAAEMGRGTFTYIGNTAEVDEKMTELINKVETPALTNIQLKWPNGVQADLAPERIGDLYSGEPLVVTARLSDEPKGTLLVSGVSSKEWTRQLQLGRGQSHEGIGTLWARNRIAELMDKQANRIDEDAIRGEVLPLALNYKLVTKYTSLVAIDKTPVRRADESLDAQRIPNTKPDGSKWDTVSYPKTATPAQLQLLIGALLLSLAGFVGFWWPWRRFR